MVKPLVALFCAGLVWPSQAAPQAGWAFEPLRAPLPPTISGLPGSASPIDLFLADQLAQSGLRLNPRADSRTLARRAWFDLIGLPPAPEEMEAFLSDPSPNAYERLIDELLARPQYGERWGRHWLDVVRFGETNGYERDGNKPEAWRYRDYVIRAFNDDKPYDRFIVEQLAGDELPEFSAEAIVATGFYRLHVWDDEPDSTVQAEFDDLDDIVVTTSGAFLGLTLGCARCHDHKFDPISQKEYYEFLAYLRNINPHGLHHTGGGGRGLGKITRPLAAPGELAAWEADVAARLKAVQQRLDAATDDADREQNKKKLEELRRAAPPFPVALAVTEQTGELKPTHVLIRGQPDALGEAVQPGVPAVLGSRLSPEEKTRGRLALARWIASPKNPLTARVMVNRIWQHHFGRGIVPSPSDFGETGEAPTHPALLDYLAQEFIRSGWSVKHMHRLIMRSHAYQMDSSADHPPALAADQANRLFWRQNPRRLEAELIRDAILAFSGDLNLQAGGPGFYPDLPAEIHRTQDSEGKGWGQSSADQRRRRSVYIFVKRALPTPLLEAFDLSTTASPMPQRPVTTVAPQALMLLNDRFIHAQARIMLGRLAREAGSELSSQVERAFQIVLQRPCSAGERQHALEFVRAHEQAADTADPPGLLLLCVALFNLNETIYVD